MVSAQAHMALRVGAAVSTMSGSFITGSEGGEWGAEFRLVFDRKLWGNVEFVTGVGTIQKGGRKITAEGHDSVVWFTTNYLQVPFVIRPAWKITENGWWIAPFTGLNIASNTGCMIKSDGNFGYTTDCHEDSIGGDMKLFELSVPIGVDAFIEFEGGSRLEFEVRVDVGLTNIFDEAEALGLNAYNRVLILQFGFSYPI